MRIVGPSMRHPERGGRDYSCAEVAIDRGLKSGRLDMVELNERELLDLAYKALGCALILREVNARKGGV